jgi:tRNA(adenine34) deaminase
MPPEDPVQPHPAAVPAAALALADDALDRRGMQLALDQALNAELVGEVPVGAVLVRRDADGLQVVATGYNRPITTHDPTAHAEIVALRHAATLRGNYRLPDLELYVTLEPCAMCAMALMHARIRRVVFGAPDPKTGAAGSVLNVFALPQLNHHTRVHGGVMAEACGEQLRHFFVRRRAEQRQRRGQGDAALASGGPVWTAGAAEPSVGLPPVPPAIAPHTVLPARPPSPAADNLTDLTDLTDRDAPARRAPAPPPIPAGDVQEWHGPGESPPA